MKIIKTISVILFTLIIMLPMANFNFESNAISKIDNRELAENPFSGETFDETDLTTAIDNYISDRIGFRNEMIKSYTVMNDKLFGVMVHPSYTYGKDGYVFGAGISTSNDFGEFHIAFADMVKEIQSYCDARSIPFVFVFNPAKPAVLTEYLAKGINYDRSWVDSFFGELDKRNVRYVDNTVELKNRYADGEAVFNQKFDANHWNDIGAFYGTNSVLNVLKEFFPNLHINSKSDFNITETLEESLLVSNFPINEYVPTFSSITECSNIASLYAEEIELDPSYRNFGYYKNEIRGSEGSPKALVFQGSYMNGYGYKYFANSFSEYIHIHDYQNILRFPYYFQIFDPDCVVFEVAEYTFSNIYFDFEKMKSFDLNPLLKTVLNSNSRTQSLSPVNVEITSGESLTNLIWKTSDNYDNVWLTANGKEFDMEKVTDGYSLTIIKGTIDTENIKIYAKNGSSMDIYESGIK